jgi:hypothetical protein
VRAALLAEPDGAKAAAQWICLRLTLNNRLQIELFDSTLYVRVRRGGGLWSRMIKEEGNKKFFGYVGDPATTKA